MDNSSCLLIEDALAMNSKMPMKQIYSCIVCTKNYFFVVPTKTIGMFVIFNTIKENALFENLSIQEGLKNLIEDADNVEAIESKLITLLEDDENYIFNLSEAKSTKIKSFLGKKTYMYRKPKSWSSFSPKSSKVGKSLVAFYAN
jgi:hypothetical protein